MDQRTSMTEDRTGTTSRHSVRRALILAGVLIAAIVIVALSPLATWLQDFGKVRQAVRSLGVATYPVCILVMGALVTCGVPRLALCGVAGAVLGLWGGILVGEVGALLGSYSLFLFSRWGGRAWALHHWPKLAKLASLIEQQGIMGVILLRQIPIHGSLTNLCLGLSHLKHRQFLIATAIGLLPEGVPATLIGAGIAHGELKGMVGYFVIAAAVFAILWIAGGYWLRKLRKTSSAAAVVAEVESLQEAN